MLGHDAENPSPVQEGGAVVQLSPDRQRKPQHDEQIRCPGLTQNHGQLFQRFVQQRLLKKQVAAGIGGQRQLREDQQLHLVFLRLPDDLQKPGAVGFGVCHQYIRGGGRHPDKSIFH